MAKVTPNPGFKFMGDLELAMAPGHDAPDGAIVLRKNRVK